VWHACFNRLRTEDNQACPSLLILFQKKAPFRGLA
jgi:hypothetical protein